MAETSVLSISLKEYKASIDDLRGSLLGLEKGSEDYNSVVEEIRERQQTLNDVMRAGKADIEAEAGSIASLKDELKVAQDLFNNLQVGSDKWQEAKDKVNELTTQLNEAKSAAKDATVEIGGFQVPQGYQACIDKLQALKQEFVECGDAAKQMELSGEINAIEQYTNSLAGLEQHAKELKAQFSTMDLGSEQFKAAQAELKNVNNKIGTVRESAGLFSNSMKANASAFTGALNSMGAGVSNLIPMVEGLGAGLKALVANPWVAALAAAAIVLQKLASAFTSSDKNANGLAKAMAPLKAIGDMITRAFEALAGKIIELIEPFAQIISQLGEMIAEGPGAQVAMAALSAVLDGLKVALEVVAKAVDALYKAWGKFADFAANTNIPGLSDWGKNVQKTREEVNKLKQDEANLAKMKEQYDDNERTNLVQNAKLQNQAEALRAQIADKVNLSAKERKKLADQLRKVENQIVTNNEKQLRLKLNILHVQNSLSGSTDAQLKAEAEIRAQLEAQKGERSKIERTYNKTIGRLTTAETSSIESAKKKREEAEKKKVEAAKKSMQSYIDFLNTELSQTEKNSGAEFKIRQDLAEKERELATYTAKHEEMTALALQQKLASINVEYLKKLKGIFTDRITLYREYNDAVYKQQELADKVGENYIEHKNSIDAHYYEESLRRTQLRLKDDTDAAAMSYKVTNDTYAKRLMKAEEFQKAMRNLEPFKDLVKQSKISMDKVFSDLDTFKVMMSAFFSNTDIEATESQKKSLESLGLSVKETNDYMAKYAITLHDADGEIVKLDGDIATIKSTLRDHNVELREVYANNPDGSEYVKSYEMVATKTNTLIGNIEAHTKSIVSGLSNLFKKTDEELIDGIDNLTNTEREDIMRLMVDMTKSSETLVNGLKEVRKAANDKSWSNLMEQQSLAISKLMVEEAQDMIKSSEQYTMVQIALVEKQLKTYDKLAELYPEIYEQDATWQKKKYDLELQLTNLNNELAQKRADKARWEFEMRKQYGDKWQAYLETATKNEERQAEYFNSSEEQQRQQYAENAHKRVSVAQAMFGAIFGFQKESRSHTQDYLDREAALYDIQHMKWDENRETYQEFLSRKEDALKRYVKSSKKLYAQDGKNLLAFANATGDLLSNVGDMYMDEVERKEEAGEEDKEELQKEFKRAKKLQETAAWINTISGAIGAFEQAMQTYPAPWGAIIGGVQSAAALAAGIAQVNQIKAQTFDPDSDSSSDTSGGGTTVSVAAATPLLDEATDIQDLQSLNVNGNSESSGDQRVYILQSDISDSNKQVSVRQTNTTF